MALFITTQSLRAQQTPVLIDMPYVYFCVGGNTVLDAGTGTCAASYLWNPSGETTQTITVNHGGLFTVTITYADGGICEKKFIVVNYPTNLADINVSGTLCTGNNITLSTAAGCNYVWSSNDYSFSNPNGPSTTFTPNQSGAYTFSVTATNYYGCADTKTISVNVNPSPVIIVTNADPTICSGNSSTMIASGASTYTWNTGSTNASLTVNPNSTTVYTVTGANTEGCSATATSTVTVVSGCPTITNCNLTAPSYIQHGTLAANAVSGANMYEFRLEEVNSSGTIIGTFYGTSSSNAILLGSINNPGLIHYNSHYLTSVRVSSNGGATWTPYGPKCNLYTTQPANNPNNGYCGIHRGNLLNAYSLNGMSLATQYKLRITIVGDPDPSHVINYVIPNGSSAVTLQNIPGIVYNTNYTVEISSFVPYSYDNQTGTTIYDWSPYGNPCPLYLDNPINNPNNGYCGIHRNNLSSSYSVNTMGMAQQYRLRFRINGDNDPTHYIEYTIPAGSTATTLSNIPGIVYNTIYTVEIASYVPFSYDFASSTYQYQWSPYGATCLFYMDQPANNPNNGYCGIHRNNLSSSYSVNTMGMAQQYRLRLRVNGDNDPNHYITHTMTAGSTAVTLSTIQGLTYNTIYTVEIASYVPLSYDLTTSTYQYEWSSYGATCLFYMDQPANTPGNGYCGITRSLNGPYCARVMAEATQYRYRLTENSNPTNVLFSVPMTATCFSLNSTNVPGLQNNTHYLIEISTFVPYTYDIASETYTYSDWSPYGNPCDLYIGNPPLGSRNIDPTANQENDEETKISLLSEKLVLTNESLSVFPNPSEDYINVAFENIIANNTSAKLNVTDLNGKIILSDLIEADENGFLSKKLDVSQLSAGTYIIETTINNQKITKRFVKE